MNSDPRDIDKSNLTSGAQKPMNIGTESDMYDEVMYV